MGFSANFTLQNRERVVIDKPGVNTQIPWKLIDGICWLIQALTFLVIAVLIIHEKRFQAVTHPLSLRVFWIVNFIIIALFASFGIVRIVSGTRNTSVFESEDIISLVFLLLSVFLLIVSIAGSTRLIVTTKSESLNGNGEVSKADDLNKPSKVSRWATASIPAKVFWPWMNLLLTKGYTMVVKLGKEMVVHGAWRSSQEIEGWRFERGQS
ncbi:hypothetical protein L6452_19483 [Arctium lappa]|uniref:Uncharacterized protein n=1 Tax=Arctium lappa TaxID=4217 RepID=A0ACB9B7Z1_ARCLA|nr:hypothetical protein L6452_19483 [Arctium lappa]